MGTAGDDSFHFKVSADGANWNEALVIDVASGLATVHADPTAPLGLATKHYVDQANATSDVISRAKARRAASAGGPIWPSVFANPPTLSNVGPGGASPINGGAPRTTAYNGQILSKPAATASATGAVLSFASVTDIVPGMAVTHGVANPNIPAGTTVVSVSGGTVTLSSAVTGSGVAAGDTICFGNSVVSFLGFSPVFITQYGSNYIGNGVNASGTRPPYAIEFDHYGTDLALVYRAVATYPAFWVFVDGQPATSAPVQLSGLSPGSLYRYRIRFNNAADSAARLRRIRIYMSLADFGGIEFEPTAAIIPAPSTSPKIALYGDSWVEGALNPVPFTQVIASAFGQMFGAVTYICGQGGTGFLADGGDGTKAAYTDATRLAALAATGADVVLIMGSQNDVSSSSTSVQSAASAVITAVQAAMPNAKIILCGVQPNAASLASLNSNLNYRNPNDGVAAAAAAAGLPFIDLLKSGWVYGSGYQGNTQGDGNADILIGTDGTHPTPGLGTDVFARLLAEQVGLLL